MYRALSGENQLMTSIGPTHFRYTERIELGSLKIVCDVYCVSSETTNCYWVVPDFYARWINDPDVVAQKTITAIRRRIYKNATRSFCYPDKTAALESYLKRKASQIKHAEYALINATAAVKVVERLLKEGKGIDQAHMLFEDKEPTLTVTWN
jgi:hypothetical protein